MNHIEESSPPRTLEQEQYDMDSEYVTVTMPPVTKRRELVFRAEQSDWPAVQRLSRQFAREMDYDSNPPIWGKSGDVWLVRSEDSIRAGYSLACGAAEVSETETGGHLLIWMWIHPNQRKTGEDRTSMATPLWQQLIREYGTLKLAGQVSPAMTRFVNKQSQQLQDWNE